MPGVPSAFTLSPAPPVQSDAGLSKSLNEENMIKKHAILTFAIFTLLTACTHFHNDGHWSVESTQKGLGTYGCPGYGSLDFNIPDSWSSKHIKDKTRHTETIEFAPITGNLFLVMIDPMTKNNGCAMGPEDQAIIKWRVEDRGNGLLENAKENSLEVFALKGVDSACFYYTLEDKSSKPGEWGFLTQGEIIVGEYCLYFTILTHSSDSQEKKQALEMLTTCSYNKP